MKKILFILLIGFSLSASAKNYYVKNKGSNSNVGISDELAWATISEVNKHVFVAGDSLFFKRGDTFEVPINNPLSILNVIGNNSNGFYIGAYGPGDKKPILTGFTTLTGWVNDGGNIWHKAVSTESQAGDPLTDTHLVTVDGINVAMGRYPKTGWRTTTIGNGYDGQFYITDNTLTDTPLGPNWSGAEIVLRKHWTGWMTDRNIITTHIGTRVNHLKNNNWIPNDNFGYFFQDDIKTLTYDKAWYFNGTTLFMYFADNDPSKHVIKMGSANVGVRVYQSKYVKVDNLDIQGFNWYCIKNERSSNITYQNSNIQFCAYEGIVNYNSTGLTETQYYSSITIDNNTISDINGTAIDLMGYANAMWVKNNKISNIGMFYGMGSIYGHDNWGDGIDDIHDGTIIEYNTLTNIGHSGICSRYGDKVIIRNNFINTFGFTRSDCGGIYIWEDEDNAQKTVTISNNIIINGNKTTYGINNHGIYNWGLYVDDGLTGKAYSTIFNGNTSVNNGSGMLLYISYITAKNNIFYNNKENQVIISSTTTSATENTVFENNYLISKDVNQPTLFAEAFGKSWGSIGRLDNNYYARPINDSTSLSIASSEVQYKVPILRNLEGWQTYSGQDAHSHKSPITIKDTNDLRFEYNASKKNKIIPLIKPMIDIEGKKYAKTITLLPFTSAVLMVDPNPDKTIYKETNNETKLFSIYPNPTSFFINISILEPSLKPISIRITKLSGGIVFEEVFAAEIDNIQIPKSELPGSGIYIIEMRQDFITKDTEKLLVVN